MPTFDFNIQFVTRHQIKISATLSLLNSLLYIMCDIWYRRVLSDIAVWIYQGITKMMEEEVQPFLVIALLEHEGIGGLSGQTDTVLYYSFIIHRTGTWGAPQISRILCQLSPVPLEALNPCTVLLVVQYIKKWHFSRGCGSGSAWIRIRMDPHYFPSWIRIQEGKIWGKKLKKML